MNKTVSVNIGGLAFKLDEDAFQKIKRYLDAIKERFDDGKDQDEIMSDIETRVGEIFTSRLKPNKDVINIEDVDYMIGIMGQPHDIGEGADGQFEDTQEAGTFQESSSSESGRKTKRLFRDPDDNVLGGVAAGLSAYFGIKDPIWLRLVIVLLTIAGVGAMIPIYILLWIIIPEAKTRTDKLQMRGEEANLANIEKAFKKGIENLEDSIKDFGAKKKVGQFGNILRTLVSAVLTICLLFLKFISKFLGIIFLVTGSVAFAALIFAMITNKAFIHPGVSAFTEMATASGFESTLFFIGVLLTAGIPLLAILYLGLRITIGSGAKLRGLGFGMLALWILGIVFTAGVAIKTASDFSETASVKEESALFLSNSDTLVVYGTKFKETDIYEANFEGMNKLKLNKIHFADKDIYLENVNFYIDETEEGLFKLSIEKEAKGKNRSEAKFLAEKIEYNYEQSESELILQNYLHFLADDKFRDQQVNITLYVPDGKVVKLDPSLRQFLYNLNKQSKYSDFTAYDNYWLNERGSFACISCDSTDEIKTAFNNYEPSSLDFKDFDKLYISGMFEVDIAYGEEYSLQLIGNEKSKDRVNVRRKDGNSLHIESDKKLVWRKNKVRVEVVMPELSRAEFNGATTIKIAGFTQESMRIQTTGAAESEIDVNVEALDVSMTGASSIVIRGIGNTLNVSSAGAAELDALDYKVKSVDFGMSGASSVKVNVSESITGKVSGASSITYKGDPRIELEKGVMSSVERID
ncbi:MAG: PspC domain-containing protein [Chitinophagales bacterium]|nr:PspC domain-containing protein [Chitinophagales bacterium]